MIWLADSTQPQVLHFIFITSDWALLRWKAIIYSGHKESMHTFPHLPVAGAPRGMRPWLGRTPWGHAPSHRTPKPLALVRPSRRQPLPQITRATMTYHAERDTSQLSIPETGVFKYAEDIHSNLRAITETKPQRLHWQPLILKPIICGRYRL